MGGPESRLNAFKPASTTAIDRLLLTLHTWQSGTVLLVKGNCSQGLLGCQADLESRAQLSVCVHYCKPPAITAKYVDKSAVLPHGDTRYNFVFASNVGFEEPLVSTSNSTHLLVACNTCSCLPEPAPTSSAPIRPQCHPPASP